MRKLRGMIEKISEKAVTFVVAEGWRCDEFDELKFVPVGRTVTVTLPPSPEVLDDLIANCTELVELSIEGGKIVTVEKVKPEPALAIEELEGGGKSHRDKTMAVLEVLTSGDVKAGVAKEDLVRALEKKYGISPEESEKIIRTLIREGSIYEPRPGWLKVI